MMDQKGIADLLKEHPFFKDLKPEFLELISGCGRNVHFDKGDVLFKEGTEANVFYVLRAGRITLQMAVPGKQRIVIETLTEGQITGWSWLIAPHKWAFDGVAAEDTRAVSLDGKCLREKCEENHDFGYELVTRISRIVTQRLQAARLHLLDIYGQDA